MFLPNLELTPQCKSGINEIYALRQSTTGNLTYIKQISSFTYMWIKSVETICNF